MPQDNISRWKASATASRKPPTASDSSSSGRPHTEYYNYQIWHLPNSAVTFGPLAFPDYKFPLQPLGTEVCRLDILLSSESLPSREQMRTVLPGPVLYGSRILDEQTSLVTSFTPDELIGSGIGSLLVRLMCRRRV